MSEEDAFAKLLGRRPTAAECERLYRVRDALGLRDNDALWSVLLALEHYDACFRVYPERLEEVTKDALDRVRESCTAIARAEARVAQHALADRFAEEAVRLARKLAQRPLGWHWISMALAGLVAFGALCMAAGYRFSGRGPLDAPGPRDVLGRVLSMPAGWMVFVLLMPAAVQGARTGWSLARGETADPSERSWGWTLVAVCFLGLVACAMLVAKLT